jgi:hypothetical protein
MTRQSIDTLVGYLPTILSAAMVIITALGHTLPDSRFQRACLALGVNAARFFAEVRGRADPTASTQTTAGASSSDPTSDAVLASAAQYAAARKGLADAVARSSVVISEASFDTSIVTPIAAEVTPTHPATPSAKFKASE